MPLADSPSPSNLCLFLSQTMIFQGLPVEQLTELAALAIEQTHHRGDILFHQGDAGNGFFVVRSGRIKVFKLSTDGKEQILHIFGSGDHFAEVPAWDGDCFPASAAAIEKSEVLFFPRQSFFDLLAQQPALTINLLKSFARHLRHFSHLVDTLTLREVPARLAVYLLNLSSPTTDPDLVTLDLTKGQLAARLGTIPETLSRAFAKLSQENLIEMNGSQIKLLDRDRLNQFGLGKTA
ncbi:MAG: Crp/Fnr family transcriptional regulator [Elainella sp. Prado103]|nr:Crp/Fnr family transcriptional regulator [Elainella sp. Prado103]